MTDYLDFQAVTIIRVDDFPLPPATEKDRILDIIRERKFRNIITFKLSILTDLLEQNRANLLLNEKPVVLLKQYDH